MKTANTAKKLTLADAIRIRVLHRRGQTQRELAEMYGVTVQAVNDIVNRKAHRWPQGKK